MRTTPVFPPAPTTASGTMPNYTFVPGTIADVVAGDIVVTRGYDHMPEGTTMIVTTTPDVWSDLGSPVDMYTVTYAAPDGGPDGCASTDDDDDDPRFIGGDAIAIDDFPGDARVFIMRLI